MYIYIICHCPFASSFIYTFIASKDAFFYNKKQLLTYIICRRIILKKSIFIVLIAITLLLVVFIPKKEKETNLTTINLAEVTHSVFYAPLYVSIEKGFFKNEGIDINLILL